MKTYFTSSRQTWPTPRYSKMLLLMRSHVGGAQTVPTKDYYANREDWEARHPTEIASCDRLVFFRDELNWIGKGVFTEIQEALITHKPVFLMTDAGQLYAYAKTRCSFRDPSGWARHAQIQLLHGAEPDEGLDASAASFITGQRIVKPSRKRKTPFWRTKDGRRIRVQDMTDGHLQNAVALLELHQIEDADGLWEALNPKFEGLSFDALWKEFEHDLLPMLSRRPVTTLLRDMTRVPVYRAMLRELKRRKLTKKPRPPLHIGGKVYGDVPDDWGGEDWGDIPSGGPHKP